VSLGLSRYQSSKRCGTNKLDGLTACLRRAGEILSDRVASEELHDDKFSQLMRNKTVHLLALFLVVYIGVEVTIGGIILLTYVVAQQIF
jgi:fucose permease